MVGIEDQPERSGEICLFEVFGDSIDQAGPAVGMGIHPFRDPALHDDFATPRLPIDVTDFHVYAADWRPGRVDFFVDGHHVHTVGARAGLSDADDDRRLRFPCEAGGGRACRPAAAVRTRLRPRGLSPPSPAR